MCSEHSGSLQRSKSQNKVDLGTFKYLILDIDNQKFRVFFVILAASVFTIILVKSLMAYTLLHSPGNHGVEFWI